MIGETLNIENLTAIKIAMEKIKEIDRSQFFNEYYNEVLMRISDTENLLSFHMKED